MWSLHICNMGLNIHFRGQRDRQLPSEGALCCLLPLASLTSQVLSLGAILINYLHVNFWSHEFLICLQFLDQGLIG